MANADFYRINFEKEISLQGRSTIFLSIEATEDYQEGEALWVTPFVQPQTFETKFEGWASAANPAMSTVNTILLFKKSDFAKNGQAFSEAAWDSIKSGDDVKAVTMWRRTLNGEITDEANGPSDVIRYGLKVGTKGTTLASLPESPAEEYYFIELDDPSGRQVGLNNEFLVQIGSWKTDNNWSINQGPADDIAKNSIGGSDPVYYQQYDPIVPNQFDGMTSLNSWPESSNFQLRQLNGIRYPWSLYDKGGKRPPRMTWRIDYDGADNSHLKINFLIVKTTDPAVDPNTWNPEDIGLDLSQVVYGQKLGEVAAPVVDYQEVHLFGYAESSVRPSRQTYQNEYPTLSEIYDDRTSFAVLKTNPKVTGNIKLTVDSNGALWLNTIDANEELSDSRYKKYPVSSNTSYQRDLYYFLNNGKFPKDSLYALYQKDTQYLNTKREYSEQYDNFYNYGVEQLKSKFYTEDFTFLAPIWLRKTVPDFFVIFRLDHPINPLSYSDVANLEKFNEFFKDARIVKTFDMRESSPLGTYIRKIVNDSRFQERPLEVSFDKDVQTSWSGIDYASGTITSKGEFLYDFWNSDNRILDFEETITGGFERNGIISSNLINLEFLFNDSEATPYTINRYFGFYVTENQLAEFEIEPSVLGSITGQTPGPKVGTDGEPFNLQPFYQSNANGVQLPVHYYHNGSDGTDNLSNVPLYNGYTVGKFPLPPMVEDPLRVFYVKDRNGTLKRVNKIQEVTYGNIDTPSGKRVTQLQLFDTIENISDYGGITQLSSQSQAELLSGGNSQLVVYIEDLQQSGRPLADGEVLEINYKKLNAEKRDYYYKFIATTNIGSVWNFAVYVPDYSGNYPTNPNVFYTEITIDTGSANIATVDSFLTMQYGGAGLVSTGNIWNVHVQDGNIVSQTSSSPAVMNFYGEPSYTSFTWRMTSNSSGLLPGESWDYPVMDPYNHDYRNNFSGVGTPTQVANAIAECINSFENRIVQAYAEGPAVYVKSLKKWEDGNNISFSRTMSGNKSVIKNLGFYERCNAANGDPAIEITTESLNPLLESAVTIKPKDVYGDRYFYVQITPFTTDSWSIQVRRDVTPDIPYATGELTTYFIGSGNTLLDIEEMTIDLSEIGVYTAAVIHYKTATETIQQYFIGGAKRKRARAKISLENGKRYYQDRKVKIDGTTISGSSTVSLTSTVGVYVGALVAGSGIPSSSRVLQINSTTNAIVISSAATASATVTLTIGETSILNDAEIYQQWFQVQKGNYSRLKGWSVQGKYVYSLPYLEESGLLYYNDYSIIQVGNDQYEFYQTSDKRIVAYEVYRPVFGLLSFYPIKTFDVDTYFSEYSYAPTLELFRYFNREELTSQVTTTNNLINAPLYLNMGENYEFTMEILETPPPGDTIDVQLQIELYDSNDQNWKYADTITSKLSLDPVSPKGARSILLNTYYPLYFYDNMEVPNDYNPDTFHGYIEETYVDYRGPYNYLNPQLDPAQLDQLNSGPQYSAAGTRNYVRKTLYTDGDQEGHFIKARISKVYFWESAASEPQVSPATDFYCKVSVQSVDYYNDNNIQKFAGFSTLADFLTYNDVQEIQKLTDEKSIGKFTYQMLLSEYDRLRENSQKDLAVKSKVVPYILKWVQEGTDARDNYYRLNNSTAFGITNFSPDSEVDFTEALLLTHEFPYLDNVPKDYPTESLEGSRSYFFQKLSDVAHNGKSWYELLTSDNTNDWFGKYFVVGMPTELDPAGMEIPKSREERYTFFNYINGLDLSQTLFRGAKINIIDYDTTVNPRVPINESKRFDHYRFAAIARFVSHHNFSEEKPIQIELIDNQKFKTILMVITIYVQDYRLAAGLGDYSFFYYAIDQLRNSMQTQYAGGYGSWSQFFKPRPYNFGFTTPDIKYPMEMPYTSSSVPFDLFLDSNSYNPVPGPNWSYFADDIQQAFRIMRPRQLFLGAGRLELDDVKLGGKTWIAGPLDDTDTVIKVLFQPLSSADGTNSYPSITSNEAYYPINKEIFPTIDPYEIQIRSFLGGIDGIPNFTAGAPTNLPFTPKTMTVDGTLSEVNTNTRRSDLTTPSTFFIYDTRSIPETISIDYVLMDSTEKYIKYAYAGGSQIKSIIGTYPAFTQIPANTTHPPYRYFSSAINFSTSSGLVTQSFNLRGGTQFYTNRKNFISYANIFKIFNTESKYVLYRKIDETGAYVQETPDFNLQFVPFDKLKKTSKLFYKDDEDKPLEYQNTDFIGFDSVTTAEQEYEFRHRGLYEPKMLEIISFWAREDESFTSHYEKDFLLRNTHINGSSVVSGILRNYFYSKVSPQEVLKISRTSAYKSLYPLIGEVAIDKRNLNAIDSSWDSGFYRKYSSTTAYTDIPGTEEMQETKVFLASKAMAVPKSFTFETFLQSEASHTVVLPKKSIGVSSLEVNATNESQALQSKPILRVSLDLYSRLQRGLLEGILNSESFDEFAWMTSLGITALEYTASEIEALKIEYIQKNIIPLYEVTSIVFYSNTGEGLPIFDISLTDAEKNAAGYREDQNVKNTSTGDYTFILEKTLDTKTANAYSISAVLKRI